MMTLETLNEGLGQKITQEVAHLGEILEKRFVQIDEKFVQVDQRFEQMDERFEQIDQRFEHIDLRFEQIDRRFEHIDLRFEQIDRRFEHIDQKFENFEVRIDGKIDDLAAMTARGFLEVNERLEAIEENYATKDDLMTLQEHLEASLLTV